MPRPCTATDARAAGLLLRHADALPGQNCVVSRTGYTGEDGVEFMVPRRQGVELWEELVRRGRKPCGLGARDTLRLEAAMPLYGHELNEEIDPFQAGLGWAVKLDKGDFIGREALLRRQEDTTPPRARRAGTGRQAHRPRGSGGAGGRPDDRPGHQRHLRADPEKAIAMAYVDPAIAAVGSP